MNMIKTAIAAAALAFALSTGAIAADQAAGTAAPAATTVKKVKAPKVAKPAAPKSEASMACSKDADAKNLHGKERKKFRETCMKTAKTAVKKM